MATRPSQGLDDLSAEPRSVDLRDSLSVLHRRWLTVVLITLLGGALAVGYTLHKGQSYAATSQVVVQPATQGPINPPAAPNLQVNMVTEQAVAQSAPVTALAAKYMTKNETSKTAAAVAAGKMASHLTVAVPLLSNLLQITWKAGTPQAAQAGANDFARAYLTYRQSLLSGQISHLSAALTSQVATLQRQIRAVTRSLNNAPAGSPRHQTLAVSLSQLNNQLSKANATLASLPTYNVTGGTVIPAPLPLTPAGFTRKLILILGLLVGLLAGVAVAIARDAFDDNLRDAEVLERKIGAPTLAILPSSGVSHSQRRGQESLFTVSQPDSAAADAFRALRTTLTSMSAGGGLSSIVVVGADASVPASQVAADVGIALAESGRRTLLVAGDLFGSSLPQIFGQSKAVGLTNVLVEGADPASVTQHPTAAGGALLPVAVSRQLTLLSPGPPIARPLSVLDSVAMGRFLKSLHEEYDFVVLDAPPASEAADYLALARLADGVVVAATEGRSKARALAEMRRRLEQIGGYVVGSIFISRRRSTNQGRSYGHGLAEPIPSAELAGQRANGRVSGKGPTSTPTAQFRAGSTEAGPSALAKITALSRDPADTPQRLEQRSQ